MDTPKAYFDHRAGRYWADLYGGTATNHYQLLLRRRRELIEEMLNGLQGPSLELGCGPGVFVEALARLGSVFVGDISFNMVREARQRTAGRNTAAQLSAGALPFRAAAFNVITVAGVLEYVEDEDASLREIHRVLAPDGVAILTFPARKAFEHGLRRVIAPARDAVNRLRRRGPIRPGRVTPRLEREHTFGETCRILERAGFRIEASRAFHYFYFPWNRVFFAASCALDRALGRAEAVVPSIALGAQSWIFRVRRSPAVAARPSSGRTR